MKVVPLAIVIVDPSVPVVASSGIVLLPVPCFDPAPSAELESLADEDADLLDSFFLSTRMAATAPAAMTEECE